MNPRTVWVGPVASYQVHAPASDLFVSCVGADGSPICADLDLATVFASKGVHADQPIILHGFSAGGDAIKKFLKNPGARAHTIAVVTHDATYQGFGSDEGFISYGTEAAQNMPGRVFVATASGGGSSQARGGISDSASMEALRQAIEANTGKQFQPFAAPWAPKPPVKAWKLGGTVLLDFGTSYTHTEHATVLASLVFDNVVAPMLAASSSAPSGAAPAPSAPAVPAASSGAPTASSFRPFPSSIPAPGRPVWPAVLVAGGAGLFLYALVHTFRK